jgi:hypothetical protein
MPGHADSLNKLYEALLAGTTGCKQAFGENHLWSVFAKPEVSGSQSILVSFSLLTRVVVL